MTFTDEYPDDLAIHAPKVFTQREFDAAYDRGHEQGVSNTLARIIEDVKALTVWTTEYTSSIDRNDALDAIYNLWVK